MSLPSFTFGAGLIKVAIETKNLNDMYMLSDGLRKLNKSDPAVEIYLNENGEYIVSTCGQVHLERCIKDLKDDFVKGIDIQVSDPIITFKETIT